MSFTTKRPTDKKASIDIKALTDEETLVQLNFGVSVEERADFNAYIAKNNLKSGKVLRKMLQEFLEKNT